jgi:hypothetical protein
MEKSFEEMRVFFVPNEESSLILKPTDGAFDLPAFEVSPQRSSVLARRLLSSFAMWGHLFNAATFKSISQPIGVRGFVIEQSLGTLLRYANINKRFNGVDFSIGSRCRKRRDGNAMTFCHQHKLCAFAFFGFTHLKPPFFAGEKVPSPIACDQSSSFRRSMILINVSQALTSSPASVHALCRRQQVAGDGYFSGKSFHLAPFFSIQRMPSRQARASTRGRPPSGEGSGSSNKSLMMFHCESETNGFGAVLDPVVFGRRRFGHEDRLINMRATPFALNQLQISCH